MRNIDTILDEVKKIKNINTDADLARLFGVERNTVTNWKHRESIPFSYIIAFCEQEGISLDRLFLGKEPETSLPFPLNKSLLQDILEGIDEYLQGEDLELPADKKAELAVYLYERLLREKTEKSKIRGEVKALLKLIA